MPENLHEVRRWLDDGADAHDWGVYFRGVLAAEGQAGHAIVEERTAELRRRITALKNADVRLNHPLQDGSVYDLVISYYCIEAVATNRSDWSRYLANLVQLVAPGGLLILAAMRRCREYHVFDRTFPTAFIDETDFATELPQLGFPPEQTVIRSVSVADWAEQGFDSICCVRARRPL